MSAIVWHSWALPFFGIGMKIDLFHSCGHCFFQIFWRIECSTLPASSLRIWNSSAGIPSPNSSRKNEEAESKQKQCPVVDVTGNGSKARCCKEQYCIGTWNVRSMNRGKLNMVQQEMARVNIDILGISELKQMGMGEFSSDDYNIYYCGQESLRRNGVALIVNKSQKWQYLGAISNTTEWSQFIFKANISTT